MSSERGKVNEQKQKKEQVRKRGYGREDHLDHIKAGTCIRYRDRYYMPVYQGIDTRLKDKAAV